MKRFLAALLMLIAPVLASAQTQSDIFRKVRQIVGEPDNTGDLPDSVAQTYLDLFNQDAIKYGARIRHYARFGAAGKDTLQLPSDFSFDVSVKKNVVKGLTGSYFLQKMDSDSLASSFPLPNSSLYNRIDTIVPVTNKFNHSLALDVVGVRGVFRKFSGVMKSMKEAEQESLSKVDKFGIDPKEGFVWSRIDTLVPSTTNLSHALKSDVGEVISAYRKFSGVLKSLVKTSVDSINNIDGIGIQPTQPQMQWNRIDTLLPSTTRLDNALKNDVTRVISVYRKEGNLFKSLVNVPQDSIHKVGSADVDYYIFSSYPNPTITFGKKRAFADTLYLYVLAKNDYFAFNSYPNPIITFGRLRLTAIDTIFLNVAVRNDYFVFTPYPKPTLTLGRPRVTADSTDTMFIHSIAALPRYFISENKVDTLTDSLKKFIHFFPALADTGQITVMYGATLDTLPDGLTTEPMVMKFLDKSARNAPYYFLAYMYFKKLQMDDIADVWYARYVADMTSMAFRRGVKVVSMAK